MPYAKAKVYFDGSHYIAIPHTVRKKKAKKKTAVKKISPELEELDEDEATPFDECTQMSIFDLEKKTEKEKDEGSESVTENEDTPTEKRDNLPQISRKELFDKNYTRNTCLSRNIAERKRCMMACDHISKQTRKPNFSWI